MAAPPTADALFVRDGAHFVPTVYTRGGWSDDAQHGGPPSALLARAIEALPTAQPMMVTRFTIDLMREVPLTPLTVTADVVRDGKRIQTSEARLLSGGDVVARASALKIRLTEIDLPAVNESPWRPPPPPETCAPFDWSPIREMAWGDLERYHTDVVEIRTHEDSFFVHGPGTSWFRLRHPVVHGEETSAFVRCAALSDMGNGNSQRLSGAEWVYVNPDITLHLHRYPSGEWLGMRSLARQHDTGIGLATSELFDEAGPIGAIGQSQLIEPRRFG